MYVGVTVPGGDVYSSFLNEHVNYVSWLQTSIVETSNIIVHLTGINSYVGEGYTLYANNVPILFMANACAGLGIISFWLAFIIAQKNTVKKKINWCVAGVFSIWVINCLRISLLFIALQNKWQVNRFIDHHELFNLCAYCIIIMMMFLYHRESKKTVML
jgi:exosortase/archaeosortase family protein